MVIGRSNERPSPGSRQRQEKFLMLHSLAGVELCVAFSRSRRADSQNTSLLIPQMRRVGSTQNASLTIILACSAPGFGCTPGRRQAPDRQRDFLETAKVQLTR